MNRTALIRSFFGMINQVSVQQDIRKQWVWQFTAGKTDSIKDLSNEELQTFVLEIRNKLQLQLPRIRKEKTILALWYNIGKKKPKLNWLDEQGKISNERFSQFIEKRVGKKHLNQVPYKELLKLLQILHTIKMNYEREPKTTQHTY